MPFSADTVSGQTLGNLAARHLGDSSLFRAIADLNKINPVLDQVTSGRIQIPTREELIGLGEPILAPIVSGASSIRQSLGDIQGRIGGYTKQARSLAATVNGINGQVASEIDGAIAAAESSLNRGIQLVDWLLDRL